MKVDVFAEHLVEMLLDVDGDIRINLNCQEIQRLLGIFDVMRIETNQTLVLFNKR